MAANNLTDRTGKRRDRHTVAGREQSDPDRRPPLTKGKQAQTDTGREACTTPADKETGGGGAWRLRPVPQARLPQACCPAGNSHSKHLQFCKDKIKSSEGQVSRMHLQK